VEVILAQLPRVKNAWRVTISTNFYIFTKKSTMRYIFLFCLFFTLKTAIAQVTISVDPTKEIKAISPSLYGRNNSIPKESFASPLSAAELLRLQESGVRFLREGGGNNSTKYNWKKRLSSHPDWYNNVYINDWDAAVKTMRDKLPSNVNGMWSLQLIGKAAANTTNNFNDFSYNQSNWWTGTTQNLAGGGAVNTAGGDKATTNGNPNLYLQNWSADSTVGILKHWLNTLKIDKQRITYWNMDNEPEIWNGTHDDIISSNLAADTYMQSYFAVAKKARTTFPSIKLVGPVTANEWQWFNWMNKTTTDANGKYYCWLEYFIKRCAEEQKTSGVRLLDVLDIHFYPSESTPEQIVQMHRIFFDKNYVYSGSNGVKSINGGWDTSQTKEYIFIRINDWLNQYFGQNHGIKLGITEMDVNNNTPSVVSTWYASMMGEFMKNDVEIFTPWSWKTGMWETLHLFSKYNKTLSVQGISSEETSVSAYPSVNTAKDSMTVVLVNRSTMETKNATVNFAHFKVQNTSAEALRLANLPTSETFFSHTQNALQKSNISIANNSTTLSLPPLSTTTFSVKGTTITAVLEGDNGQIISIFPNPTNGIFEVKNIENYEKLDIFDENGRLIRHFSNQKTTQFNISDLPQGIYEVTICKGENRASFKVIKN
jgi:hypothetical protein